MVASLMAIVFSLASSDILVAAMVVFCMASWSLPFWSSFFTWIISSAFVRICGHHLQH
jgi:hypothetical protein